MTSRSIACFLVLLVSCVMGESTAPWKIMFSETDNPLETLELLRKVSGKDFYFEKGLVRTGANHGVAVDTRELGEGRFTLVAEDRYKSAVELIAHVSQDGSAYYSLRVSPSEKKVVFSRFMVNAERRFSHEFEYDGARAFTLSLDFVHGKIIPRCNGRKLGEFEDDGLLPKGYCGIRFGYYSHVVVKALEYQTLESVAGMKVNERVPRLPVDELLDWNLDNAAKTEKGRHIAICLNQIWRFQPVESYNDEPDEADENWGYLVVPGYWEKSATGVFMRNAEGEAITEWRGLKYQQGGIGAWYRRTFEAPQDWLDKHVELVLHDFSGRGMFFLNGGQIGEKTDAAMNIVRIDISGKLREGENEIRFSNTNDINMMAGLRDAYLEICPKENLGHPVVATHVAERNFTLMCMDADVETERKVEIRVADMNGTTLFQATSLYDAKMTFDWLPPRLWTPDDPALYMLEATLLDSAGNIIDETETRVGFREFSVNGAHYLLNGHPIVLKANTALFPKNGIWILDYLNDPPYFRAELALYKSLGLNCGYLSTSPDDNEVDVADEMGIMLIVQGQIMPHAVMNADYDAAMASLEENLTQMTRNFAFYRHPSIIGVLMDVWYNYQPGTMNPAFCGHPEIDPNLNVAPWNVRTERLNRMAALYKKYLPELEQFTGASCLVGNIYATHLYHTWGAPSAELRAFFENWAQNPKYPIFVGETCIPYLGSFFDLENFRGGGESYVTEQASRILGDDGYNYRTSRSGRPFHDRSHKGWRWNTTEPKDSGEFGFEPDAPVAVLETYIREIMTGWKFHGLAGWGTFDIPIFAFASQGILAKDMVFPNDYSAPGMKPEAYSNGNACMPFYDIRNLDGRYDIRPTAIYSPFRRVFENVSMDIFDKEADPLLQNHSGFSGKVFEKSVVVFNDTGNTLEGTLTVMMADNQGHALPALKRETTIAPYGRTLLPISFTLPEVESREEWTLRARLDIAGKMLNAATAVQVFPRPRPVHVDAPVFLFDPEGTLAEKLTGHLEATRLESLGTMPTAGLLIVGRGALSSSQAMQCNWEKALESDLAVLFMEQLQDTSAELLKERTRRVFINAPAHPVFDGLDEPDFHYWLDSHSIAPAKGIPVVGSNWTDWGNRNMVASFAFRRPQHGNFLSLLTCGFDLYKTPLLEYRGAKAHWLASQLEITERLGDDPVATRVFDNMVRYLARKAPDDSVPLFFGGEDGRAFLEKFGVDFNEIGVLDASTLEKGNVLLVASPDNWDELNLRRRELCDFVYWGGTVFFINTGKVFSPSWLPFTMTMERTSASRAKVQGRADGLWRNGFGNSELYWRDEQNVFAFNGFPTHFQATDPAVLLKAPFGNGQWVFAAITPDDFCTEENAAAQGKTVRLYSALFTSLHIPVKTDGAYPFRTIGAEAELDLSERKWEFAMDSDGIGLQEKWQNGENGSGSWISGLVADGIEVRVGQPFEHFLRREYDGIAWYRLVFDASEDLLGLPNLMFSVAAIDDLDEVWLNGVKIGQTGEDTPNYWMANRNYPIPAGLLKPTGNRLAVRVTDLRGDGGIVATPVRISTQILGAPENIWKSPWPNGQFRDYTLKPDIIRGY